MSPSKAHQRVREYLKGILLEPGTTSSAEAIRLLRDRHNRDLTQATPSLLDSALKAEISKIGLKSGLLGNAELPPTDLFATYQGLPTSFALHDVQGEGGTLARRSPKDATIGDAKAWVEHDRRATQRRRDRYPDVQRMIDELSPLSASDSDRLVDLHLKRLESNKAAKSDAFNSSKQR